MFSIIEKLFNASSQPYKPIALLSLEKIIVSKGSFRLSNKIARFFKNYCGLHTIGGRALY